MVPWLYGCSNANGMVGGHIAKIPLILHLNNNNNSCEVSVRHTAKDSDEGHLNGRQL